ncbi:LPS assembly lipoprotein LptE [Nitrosophilus kaiyonis]|uniref:LPS assembly lipoprotein LptE n=1 Tax=Nitrosophilus kaiyonis TaxID=2930200 RepID=UPI002490634A|nr:LPS assembly lipoprotein LptE [Nitrosophilus kaiyonis]
MFKKFLPFFFLILTILMLSGCGYKPTSIYAKKVLGQKIYTDVKVYLRDPENAVLIKDAINEAVISRFKGSLAPKRYADSEIYISLKSVSFTPLQYDKNGYVIYYRAVTTLNIVYKNKKESRSIDVSGNYDFPIEPNSVISDTKRFEAIRESSKKALDKFISQISIIGLRNRS